MDIYVSPKGSDAAEGTLEKPFQTLERARAAVHAKRAAKSDKAVTVWFRGGEYAVTHPFVLAQEDGEIRRFSNKSEESGINQDVLDRK